MEYSGLFLTVKAEVFVKHLQYNIIGAEWHWYHFEYAVIGGTIHWSSKIKGSSRLAQFGFQGSISKGDQRKIYGGRWSYVRWTEIDILQESPDAEKMIWNSYVSLLSCMNLVRKECWQNSSRNCYKKKKEMVLDLTSIGNYSYNGGEQTQIFS